MLQLFLKSFRCSLTPSRKFKFLIMTEQAFPHSFGPHVHPPWALGFTHPELLGVPGTSPPLSYLPAFECIYLFPQNPFSSLLKGRIPTNFQVLVWGQRVFLVTTLPQRVTENSLICVPKFWNHRLYNFLSDCPTRVFEGRHQVLGT